MPELGIGTNRCECTACGEFFGSVYGFDKHQVFADPKVHDFDTQRCLSPAEMKRKGWVKNERGFWVTSAMPEGVR